VVNRVDGGRAFGTEANEAVILAADGAAPVTVEFAPKAVLAAALWDAVAARLIG
jgi:phosphopantothenoylcysteine decarboxylase/phosphopantothenate--cysteine ligase